MVMPDGSAYAGDSGGNYSVDGRWWLEDLDPKARAHRLTTIFRKTRMANKWRLDQEERYWALYSKTPMFSSTSNRSFRRTFGATPRAELNVVKACSDAFTSKMCEEKPKATFLTADADWDTRQKAKRLERYCDAMRDELQVYDLSPRIVLDACVVGTGIVKPFLEMTRKGPRIRLARVLQSELTMDDREAYYGEPRSLYQSRWVDRLWLLEQYGDDPAATAALKAYRPADPDLQWIPVDAVADLVLVIEAWHLPSTEGAEDGRHTITIPEMVLDDEVYVYDEFPFVMYRRGWAPASMFGIGLAEELYGLQLQLNTMMQRAERAFHLMGATHWAVEAGSQVSAGQLDNQIGSIIRYVGTKPEAFLPPTLQPEFFEHMEWIWTKAFLVTGVNEMTAQAQKPQGLDSGKAIDTFADIQSERFAVASQAYQKWHLDLTRWIVRLSRDASEEDPKFAARFASHKASERIPWREVAMDDDEYVVRLYPTNALADEPSEKIAQVERLAKAGLIDGQDARRLLDFPDLDAAMSADDASYRAVQICIEAALDRGEYKGPQPFFDLAKALKLVTAALVQGWNDGVPDERLQLLRTWLADANDMLTKATAPPMPPPSPPIPPMPPANANGTPMPANDNGVPPIPMGMAE